MPRPLRLDHPGAMFHAMSRGVNRATIFVDDADRIAYLKILDTACERYGGRCLAYCLMGNHSHVLLQTDEGRVSALMQHLNGSFGRWFNRRRSRVGHLFQDRFKSCLVEAETYLLEVTRYIELNPCRAGLIADPLAWEWSSLRARLGLATGPRCLETDRVLELFSADRQRAREAYRRFIRAAPVEPGIAERLRSETILGSSEFMRRHAERAQLLAQGQSVPTRQRLAGRPSLDAILQATGDAAERRKQVRIAFLRYGYTMAEIGKRLGVHYTTVSRWIRGA